MPRIDLCFSGWLRGVEVKQASDVQGQVVDVSEMPTDELVRKLKAGELFVSLGELLDECNRGEEIELSEFEVNE